MRECLNNALIVGEVKSKTVRRGEIQGTPTISLELVIESKVDNKIHNTRCSFFAKQGSKLYQGYETSANELQTIVENMKGSRVKITGSIAMNEYMSQDGTFKSNTKVRGLFCNRLSENDTTPDMCGATLECVVLNVIDEMKDGKITGTKIAKIYSVGYNDTITELDLVVAPELSGQFTNIYKPNTTGKLYVNINNYADTSKNETPQQSVQVAFGTAVDTSNIFTKYVQNIQIVGGDMPMVVGKYTLDEINQMRMNREQSIQKIMSTPATPKTKIAPNGFGVGGDFAPVADDEIPF